MIDLHSHILPGIDDGAATLEEALAMARIAVDDGIRVIAATPHSPESDAGQRYSVELVQQRAAELREALSGAAIPLEVVVGTEIHICSDIVDGLEQGTLLPYAGTRTVLLELPYRDLPPLVEHQIIHLQEAGYQVLVAHPERHPMIQRNLACLAPFADQGVLFQVTAEALTGQQGLQRQQVAEQLLVRGFGHILATDAHGTSVRAKRAPLMRAAGSAAAQLIGPAAANRLVTGTPAAILKGALFQPTQQQGHRM